MSDQEKRFNELVKQYSEKLYWHVRTLVNDHDDADDLMQEIFIKVWKALPSFRGDSSVFTWLWRIATNEALNFIRKQKIKSALTFESLDAAGKVDADPFFDGDEAEKNLAIAISSLPSKQKSVFCMRYYEDLSYEEISEITGTSVGGLKSTYHFAEQKVRKFLDKKY